MLKLTVRAGTEDAIYLLDGDSEIPIAKIEVLTKNNYRQGGRQIGIGILARQEVTVLRNKLITPKKQEEYDKYLNG